MFSEASFAPNSAEVYWVPLSRMENAVDGQPMISGGHLECVASRHRGRPASAACIGVAMINAGWRTEDEGSER